MAGMITALTLLTRDGPCYMAFSPVLTVDQYAELVKLMEPLVTCEEMQLAAQGWALDNGLRVGFEE